MFNTLRSRQNGRRFADDTFKRIFLNENGRISIQISLKFVPKGSINNIPALVQIMAWHRPGDKPLSEPMMVSLPTHICVTWPQWVKTNSFGFAVALFLFDTDSSKTLTHCGLVTPYGDRSGSTLALVTICYLTAPSHYLNQCWLISEFQWHLFEGNFSRNTSAISY